MKIKIVLFALISFACIQLSNAQKFGIIGGVNFSDIAVRYDTDGDKDGELIFKDTEFLTGWNIGLTTSIDFHKNFGFEAGLIFNSKGFKYTIETPLLDDVYKTKLIYLDIPVSAKGMYNITEGVQVFGKIGPYVGIGLTGTSSKEFVDKDGKTVGSKTETDIKWGSESTQTNRFDYGLQMGLGTEIGGFLVEGIYKFSIGDIDNNKISKSKNHVFGISVGYNLDFKKFK